MESEEVYGDLVLREITKVLHGVTIPIECRSVPFKKFVFEVLSHDCYNVALKRNTVQVWQYYARKWRKYLKWRNSEPFYVGSYAEGMRNSGDVDVLYISNHFFIYDPLEMKQTEIEAMNREPLPLSRDGCHPGYLRLILPAGVRYKYYFGEEHMVKEGRHRFYKNSAFILMMKLWSAEGYNSPQKGPALTTEVDTPWDVVHAIPLVSWPSFADDFFKRNRLQYISSNDIKSKPVCVVATGYGNDDSSILEFRLSFTAAEMHIACSWNDTQLYCYYLLKNFKNTKLPNQDVLCSYYLKTIVFWMTDIISGAFWNHENLLELFLMALTLLKHFVLKQNLPNYFIPENNMIGLKSTTDCLEIARLLDETLKAENFNVKIGELICESSIENILTVIDGDLSRPVTRSCRLGPHLLRYLETRHSLDKQVIMNEAGYLSSLSLVMAIWNRKQCKAMEVTCENLRQIVSEKFVRPFEVILKRKIAGSYHNLGLRSDLKKARELYANTLELVYPSGFNDDFFSGIVHLSFFDYLNDNKKFALVRLEGMIPAIQMIIENSTVEYYMTICLPVYKVDRLWRDQVLYSLVKDLEPERPLEINVVVLALYIILRCMCNNPRDALSNNDKEKVHAVLYLYAALQNDLYSTTTFKEYKLLYQHVLPIVKECLGDYLIGKTIPEISDE